MIEVKKEKSKEVFLSDLKNTDHIGLWHSDGRKGFVIYASVGFLPVPANHKDEDTDLCDVCNTAYCAGKTYPTLKEAVKSIGSADKVFKFNTRLELYKWLSEE